MQSLMSAVDSPLRVCLPLRGTQKFLSARVGLVGGSRSCHLRIYLLLAFENLASLNWRHLRDCSCFSWMPSHQRLGWHHPPSFAPWLPRCVDFFQKMLSRHNAFLETPKRNSITTTIARTALQGRKWREILRALLHTLRSSFSVRFSLCVRR